MMLILKNFTQYIPEYADLMIPALYFQSDEGEDWYFHRTRFSDDTLKVCYDSEGVIRSFGFDASRLYPGGYSVAEVEKMRYLTISQLMVHGCLTVPQLCPALTPRLNGLSWQIKNACHLFLMRLLKCPRFWMRLSWTGNA